MPEPKDMTLGEYFEWTTIILLDEISESENPLNIQKYTRRPFTVEAVQVTLENMEEVAEWCHGVVVPRDNPEDSYIKVKIARPLNRRHTQAFIGDYVLRMGRGFKVYLPEAFAKAFVPVVEAEPHMLVDPVNN